MTAHLLPARTALLALTCAVAASCRPGPPPTGGSDGGAVATLTSADLVTVSEQAVRTGPRITGHLEPAERAQMRAEVGGSMKAVAVEVGQRVRRGQLLGRIEAGGTRDAYLSARTAMQSAETQVAIAERQAARTDRLVRAGALAERDREVASNALVTAQAQLAETKARLVTSGEQSTRRPCRPPSPAS